jgi:MFS family permease
VLNKFRKSTAEFPRTFWTLVGASFIDRLGGALIFPFLSLYIANRFQVGLTEVGLLLAVWSVSGLTGSIVGGALTDKFGRRAMLIFGLIFSAGTALILGFANQLSTFFWVLAFSGLLSDIAGPAQSAMVADLLPENQRQEGYGILRVSANLAATIGPAIGGMLAGVSYLLLFIIDAVASLITAAIVFLALPETKPEASSEHAGENLLKTFRGYRKVLQDRLFIAFIIVSIVMILVYTQMYSTLSVYLNKVHQVSPQGFGWIMSLNALMVVVMQFWITRKVKHFEPMLVIGAASICYAIGYTLYGLVSAYWLFLLAMAIITIGEMLHVPVAQGVAARFAPSHMRGRYMAIYGLSWAIPHTFATLLAGLVMDNFNPNLVWFLGGGICIFTAIGFYYLNLRAKGRFRTHRADEIIEVVH